MVGPELDSRAEFSSATRLAQMPKIPRQVNEKRWQQRIMIASFTS